MNLDTLTIDEIKSLVIRSVEYPCGRPRTYRLPCPGEFVSYKLCDDTWLAGPCSEPNCWDWCYEGKLVGHLIASGLKVL